MNPHAFRVLLSLLVIATALPRMASGQACNPVDGKMENDLCWLNKFVAANYQITAANAATFRTYTAGPDADTVSAERAPWAGNYLAWARGGIARRLQITNADSFPQLNQLNWAATQQLDSARIAKLSPVEKLDLISGNRDFRITEHELKFRGPFATGIAYWEGFCNGIRAAGALTPEPLWAVKRITAEGKIVVFEPADIKALLGAAFFYLGENNNYAQMGSNFNFRPHPGAFDIALRMVIGAADRPFFFDDSETSEIWNHTLVGYNRKLISSTPTQNGLRVLHFTTTIHHMGETSVANMGRPTSRDVARLACCVETNEYAYELTVDSSNRIIDGRWLPDSYPDVVWFASGQGDDKNHTPVSLNGGTLNYRGNPHISYELLMELLAASRPRPN